MEGEGGARDTRRKDSLFCLYLFSTFFPSPRGGRPCSSPFPPPSPHPSSSPPSVVSLPSFFSAALSFLFPCSSSLLPILVRSSRSHSPSLSFPSSPQNVAFNRASTVLAVVRNPRRFAATRGASGK